jgi:VHS domain
MDKLNLGGLGERLKPVGEHLRSSGEKLKPVGERLKSGGAEMSRIVSSKMKEILQGPSQEAKMVDEATSDKLEQPNWGLNLKICALVNNEEFDGSQVVRAIKKKIASHGAVSIKLSLELLELCAMNCDKVFSEIASEKLLDDMVRLIENSQSEYANRKKALQLINAWGQSDDLAYLPAFKQTYIVCSLSPPLFLSITPTPPPHCLLFIIHVHSRGIQDGPVYLL